MESLLQNWHIWFIAGIVLMIAEVFLPSFIAACVGIGCFVAGILALLSFGLNVQLIGFSFGTLLAFFTVRPFMLKYALRRSEKVKTNVEALIGKSARVIVEINAENFTGRVLIDGDEWRAESETGEVVAEGKKVEIVKVDSTIVYVKPI